MEIDYEEKAPIATLKSVIFNITSSSDAVSIFILCLSVSNFVSFGKNINSNNIVCGAAGETSLDYNRCKQRGQWSSFGIAKSYTPVLYLFGQRREKLRRYWDILNLNFPISLSWRYWFDFPIIRAQWCYHVSMLRIAPVLPLRSCQTFE